MLRRIYEMNSPKHLSEQIYLTLKAVASTKNALQSSTGQPYVLYDDLPAPRRAKQGEMFIDLEGLVWVATMKGWVRRESN